MKKSIIKLNFKKAVLSDFGTNHLNGGGPTIVTVGCNLSVGNICGTEGASGCIATGCICGGGGTTIVLLTANCTTPIVMNTQQRGCRG